MTDAVLDSVRIVLKMRSCVYSLVGCCRQRLAHIFVDQITSTVEIFSAVEIER